MRVEIVGEQACPECGAYWGNKDKDSDGDSLDFPNRIKVDNDWKCYNPKCEVGYYNNEDGFIEYRPNPEERKKLDERMDAYQAYLKRGSWIHTKLENGCSSSQFVPAPGDVDPR